MNVWQYDVIIVTVLILFVGLRYKLQIKKVETEENNTRRFQNKS